MTDSKSEVKEVKSAVPAERKWPLLPLLTRAGPFARNAEGFDAKDDNVGRLLKTRVLVAGAGALGCEMLKQLAMTGFVDLHIIDLDVVEHADVARNCLFRQKDLAQPKAKAAAEFVQKRCKGVSVKWYCRKLQEFSARWYSQFHFVVGAVENEEARFWLNQTLHDLVRFDADGDIDWATVVFYVCGSVEGLRGQARLVVPHYTACLDCTPPAPRSHMPSLDIVVASPRQPEHCVAYAHVWQWSKLTRFAAHDDFELSATWYDDEQQGRLLNLEFDKHDTQHVMWVYYRAEEHAKNRGIKGVTYQLVLAYLHRIVPSLASTPSLVAAACVNEVFKLRTLSSLMLDNTLLFDGRQCDSGVQAATIRHAKNDGCRACQRYTVIQITRDTSFQQFLEKLKGDDDSKPGVHLIHQGTFTFNARFDNIHTGLGGRVLDRLKPDQLLSVEFRPDHNGWRREPKVLLQVIDDKPAVDASASCSTSTGDKTS